MHRRTEGDYMSVLLDTVTLEDWRGVVAGALQAAKGAANRLIDKAAFTPRGNPP